VLAILASATFVGCKAPEEEEGADTKGPKVQTNTFEGKVDPQYAGEWHTVPDSSTLNMHDDGSVDIVATASGPGGSVTNKFKGQWCVSGKDLMIKYGPANDGMPVVLKYSADLSGDTLKLVQSANKVKSTYHRKPQPKKS